MLRSLAELNRYTAGASDGDVGTVSDFLFDDDQWVIRYLVVDTVGESEWLQVLISPISFRTVDRSTHRFELDLTKAKVRSSPGVDLHAPVSRQHEVAHHRYYGHARYWGYSGIWGAGAHPGLLAGGKWREEPSPQGENPADTHLRSAKEVRGYHTHGTDGLVGHVHDLIVDDEDWSTRYLVLDTSDWWVGKMVLVAPQWATQISWKDRKVEIGLSRKMIKNSPEWSARDPVNREYEARLYDSGLIRTWRESVQLVCGMRHAPAGSYLSAG